MQNTYFYFLGTQDQTTISTIETDLVEILESIVDCDVWPVQIPGIESATYPALTYKRTTGGRVYQNGRQFKVTQPIFELVVYSWSSDEAATIADQLGCGLNGYVSDEFPNAIQINRVEAALEPPDGSDRWLTVITLTFQLNAIESTPRPKISISGEGGDLMTGIHTYLTEQGIKHRLIHADGDDVGARFTITPLDTTSFANVNRRIGVVEQLVMFDFVGESYDELKGMCETIRTKFNSFQGTLGNCTVIVAENQNELDSYLPPIDGSQLGLFHVSSAWFFKYAY